MTSTSLHLALLSEVFPTADQDRLLVERLREAKGQGAELVALPELPLDPWYPAHREVADEEAEAPGGPRFQRLSAAARDAGIAVLGGAIVLAEGEGDATSRRRNRALLVDASGELSATYDKLHLPSEEGFWEADHYRPGSEPPAVIDFSGFPLGVQICSDLHRPQGSHLLAAGGALAILGPRATEAATWQRWKMVLRAVARTSCAYLISINRPRPELGVSMGGPTVVIGPDGEVEVESAEPLVLHRLEAGRVEEARRQYPGYLDIRADIYAEGWRRLASG